jgi:hypothetical protein
VKRFYILAGNHEQARTLANSMKLGASEWGYITNHDATRGLRDEVILTYGTWNSRDDLVEIMEMSRVREMTILYINDRQM